MEMEIEIRSKYNFSTLEIKLFMCNNNIESKI